MSVSSLTFFYSVRQVFQDLRYLFFFFHIFFTYFFHIFFFTYFSHIHFIGKQTGPVHILFFLGVEKVPHLWLKGLNPTRMQVLPEDCIMRIFVWKEGHVGTGCRRCGKGRMRLGG